MIRAGLLIALVVVGCHRAVAPEKPESFAGLRLSLSEGTALVVAGSVEGASARVVLETAQPYTSVTTGCWRDGEVPRSPGRVKVPTVEGSWRELPEIEVRAARVGAASLGARTVALDSGATCTLTLGLDVLGAYALHVDPFRRTVRFALSGAPAIPFPFTVEAQPSTTAGEVFTLTREPTRDFWLLTARMAQGEATVTGPFVFSTGAQTSRLSARAGLDQGLRAGARGIQETTPPPPEALFRAPFRLDVVELSPSSRVTRVAADAVDGWKDELAVGVLGADVWGRFVATIDVGAGRVTLWRPTDPVQLRLHGGVLSAASWTETDGGVQLVLRTEPPSTCVLGVSLPAGTAGRSVKSRLPWESLPQKFPECASSLERVTTVAIDRVAPGSHRVCEGSCVFAEIPERAAVSCACETERFISEKEEARMFQDWQRQVGGDGGVPIVPGWADEPPEPVDP